MKGAPRATACALACGLALGASGDARGQSASVEAGVRLGVGLPFGTVDSLNGDTLDSTVSVLVPVWIDLGVRIGQYLYLGPYLALGFGTIGGPVNSQGLCVGCYIFDRRLGINAHYHVNPAGWLDPWFGLGAGYEWLQIEGDGYETPGVSGWEIVNAQAGLDFIAERGICWGPFVALSLGEYAPNGVVPTASGVVTPTPTLHEWLVVGARVAFDFVPTPQRRRPRAPSAEPAPPVPPAFGVTFATSK